ncbi:MAG TPA: hypothetical protein VG456_23495 [Candidatus Sulfopaludibacter sp.]|jgi:hypothetical protein|nr:hypothetical protein [Candidatus Sulfopaludibacter sp.]
MRSLQSGALLCWLGLSAATGQPIKEWLDKQLTDAATMTASQKKPAQTQSTSLNHGSTTFVDKTSATDLLGTALNFSPVGGTQEGSGTVTASLYSFYTLASSQDPLKPSVYNSHSAMRTLFFTAGREEPSSSATTPTTAGTIAGARWLPVNRRDASAIAHDKVAREQLTKVASAFAGSTSAAVSELTNLLLSHQPDPKPTITQFITALHTVEDVQAAVDKLDTVDRGQVTALIAKFRNRMGAADKELDKLIVQLSRRWQVALDFQTTQRSGTVNSDYQIEMIADRAVNDRCFFTFNGSYLYSNSSRIGADTRNARGAFDFQYDVTHVGATSLKSPLQVSLSGEGLYRLQTWQYHAQVQIAIPIATGVNLPFSFGYGNRPELLRQTEKDAYGKFGLTLDVAKIVSSLKTGQ